MVLLISSLLNAVYFLPIVYRAFFGTPVEAKLLNEVREAPVWCMVPLALTALISVALFFYPQPFLELAELAVNGLLKP